MKGEVSSTIFVIGILALVFITVSMAYVSLGQVNFPQDEEQTVTGYNLKVAGELAKLAESCWRQSGKGAKPEKKDCFSVKIRSNGSVHRSNISQMLKNMPEENFGFPGGPIPDGESRVQVTYHPVSENVNVSLISTCRPSSGDTCYSLECSCRTACSPGFDPDGDGDPETNTKGCIQDYSFEPSTEPCDSLTCPVTDYRSAEKNGDQVIFDIGDSIGLREAIVMERPVPSAPEELEAESEDILSPREAAGYGNPERKLFRNEASINISELSPGNYGLFIWGCDAGSTPENCRWLKPFSFQKN